MYTLCSILYSLNQGDADCVKRKVLKRGAEDDHPGRYLVVVVVVSHIQRIGCQPEKNYFTRWPIPLVVC